MTEENYLSGPKQQTPEFQAAVSNICSPEFEGAATADSGNICRQYNMEK